MQLKLPASEIVVDINPLSRMKIQEFVRLCNNHRENAAVQPQP